MQNTGCTCLHDDNMARIVGFFNVFHISVPAGKRKKNVTRSAKTHTDETAPEFDTGFCPPGFRHSDLFRFAFRHLAGGHYFDLFVSAETGRKSWRIYWSARWICSRWICSNFDAIPASDVLTTKTCYERDFKTSPEKSETLQGTFWLGRFLRITHVKSA